MGSHPSSQHKSKSGKTFTVRTALPSDALGILVHVRQVMDEKIYTLSLSEELPLTEAQEVEWINKTNANPSSLILVAVHGEEVIGMLDFSPGHRQRIAHTGEFGMGLNAAFREDGIGAVMLTTLIGWAATTHPIIENVSLKVHATNSRAIALYQKFGFVKQGEMVRDLKYAPGHYVNTVLMVKFVK